MSKMLLGSNNKLLNYDDCILCDWLTVDRYKIFVSETALK